MRPDIPQKSGTVPSKSEDRSPLADITQLVPSDVSRPSGNAAAMLGIAFSMGVGSFIGTAFPAAAQTAEPALTQVSTPSPVAQEPLLTSLSQSQVAVVPQIEPQAVERSVPVKQSAVATTSVAPSASAAVVTPNTGHAVKPGETLWQIAQSYQVEVLALANANRLPAGAVLKVGQVLQLPGTIGVAPDKNTINLGQLAQSVPEVPVIAMAPANGPNAPVEVRQTAAVADLRLKQEQLKQSLAELGEASTATSMFAEAQAAVAAAAAEPSVPGAVPVTRLANVPLPAIGGPEPTAITKSVMADVKVTAALPVTPQPDAKSEFNPTPLLAEIHNLRNRYSQQKLAVTAPKATLVAQVVPTEPPAATRVEPSRVKSVAANPDFANRKSDSALSIELRNFVQPKLKPEATEKVKSAPSANAQVVARATLGSEVYAPVAPSVRRMVAPNVPTIGNADAYLPGGSASGGAYVWPAQGMLSSGWGPRWGRMHRGIDIAAPIGTPIVAVAAGKISYAGWNDGGFGYLVEVEHEDGTMTRYAHNNRILVKDGQQVAQGQQISEMGSTGFSTGPHLHFEVHPRGSGAVNPMAFLGNQS